MTHKNQASSSRFPGPGTQLLVAFQKLQKSGEAVWDGGVGDANRMAASRKTRTW